MENSIPNPLNKVFPDLIGIAVFHVFSACDEMVQPLSEWSQTNFRQNTHPVLGTSFGSVAPFLGIIEELGEAIDARNKEKVEEVVDGYCDAIIFWCDVYGREFQQELASGQTLVSLLPVLNETMSAFYPNLVERFPFCTEELLYPVSKVANAFLKRQQQIRGWGTDLEKDKRELTIRMGTLLVFLACSLSYVATMKEWYSKGHWPYLKDFLNQEVSDHGASALRSVWNKIVSKRNWVKEREQG